MTPENVSKFIKNLRKKKNLTQKKLAEELGVTYQAVSKWENGKNIPDIETLKRISKIYNVNVDEIIGNNSNKKNNKIIIVGIIILIIVAILLSILVINNNSSTFEFKEISTSCDNFKIKGSAAYNKKFSSIYISSVEFCGNNDEVYKSLECNLFEEYDDTKVRISSYDKMQNITIKDYLKNIELLVDNYSSMCKQISSSKLFIEIDAVDKNNNIITYKIPLNLKSDCK